jgi:hypothetical protein
MWLSGRRSSCAVALDASAGLRADDECLLNQLLVSVSGKSGGCDVHTAFASFGPWLGAHEPHADRYSGSRLGGPDRRGFLDQDSQRERGLSAWAELLPAERAVSRDHGLHEGVRRR